MNPAFRDGARAGFRAFLPLSVGLIPWAIVTGVAMQSAGLTLLQAMGMNVIVFAAVAQIGTLPLIVADAPLWLVALTALALNLRFLIFSAAIARGFEGIGLFRRLICGYLLIDGVFAVCADRMLREPDPGFRLGYYLAPAVWGWVLWQVSTLAGVVGADFLPRGWSLDFMAPIALMVILVSLCKQRPMLVAAIVGGCASVLLHAMPLKLGVIVAIVIGMAAGFVAQRLSRAERGAS